MSLAGYGAEGRRLWRCDTCGLVQPWGDSWSWWGSEDDSDNSYQGRAIPTFCSARCRPHDNRVAEIRAELRRALGCRP